MEIANTNDALGRKTRIINHNRFR